jgi:hypothetical protein
VIARTVVIVVPVLAVAPLVPVMVDHFVNRLA